MRPSRFRLLAAGISWALLLLLLAFGVLRVEKGFADCNIPLPRFTEMTIRASHFWIVFLLLAMILFSAEWYVADILSRQRNAQLARSWSILMIATPLLLLALALAALGLPLINPMWRLSG